MKNTGKNSRRINLFHHLLFFLLLFLLILGGTYWYITEPSRQLARDIYFINDTSKVQYKKLNNEEIVQHNENNLQESKYLLDILNDPSTNLSQKRRIEFNKLLKEISKDIDEWIEQQMLEEIDEYINKKDKDLNKEGLKIKREKIKEKENIILKILKTGSKLGRLVGVIEGPRNKTKENNYLIEQKKWFDNYYPPLNSWIRKDATNPENKFLIPAGERPEEDKKLINEISKFMKHFYEKFWGVKKLKKPKIIQVTKTVGGEEITSETPQEKIDEKINWLKNNNYISSSLNIDDEMDSKWDGFKGWHWKEDKTDSSATTVGLTTYTPSFSPNNDKSTHICLKRDISITLLATYPFSRKGKGYEKWINKNDEGEVGILGIDWNSLIHTIAHELAHAVINASNVSYRNDGKQGGHGKMHTEYTIEMEKMIKKDVAEYQKFKKFWFKK